MRILRADDHRRMPWKNGGGETVEVAVSSESAGLDDFDWRVSMAKVAQDGPFSIFPGIDRTLSLLEGRGIILDIGGHATSLDQIHEPVTFSADVPTTARLRAGPIVDLNVMSRRGTFGHEVRFVEVSGQAVVEPGGAPWLILAVAGSVSFATGAVSGVLAAHDALLADEPTSISLSASPSATVAIVEFRPI